MSHIVSAFAHQQLMDVEQLVRALSGKPERRTRDSARVAQAGRVPARSAPRRRWRWAWRQA